MFLCLRCGYRGPEGPACPRCGFPLVVEPPQRFAIIKSRPNIWRYESAIGVGQGITLGEGMTPLKRVGDVLVKDEGNNPTGSFMDRGSAVVASVYRGAEAALSFEEDFALSAATYFSARGIRTSVYLRPESLNYAEFLELLRLKLVSVRFGDLERPDVEYGDPYFLAGVKTIAYELYERARGPDAVVAPMERGYLGLALYEGFRELEEWGLMPRPKLVLVKYRGAEEGDVAKWLAGQGASIVEVGEDEAVRAVVTLAHNGIYAKPLSAMAFAVAEGMPNSVAVVTGTGIRKVKPRVYPSVGGLQAEVLDALRQGPMTAHQVWEALGRRFSLRGVYKALSSLRSRGLVEVEYKMRGGRRVKVFALEGRGPRRAEP
ncbi:MAG: pyridoxal-phosphate dependent enzyme [Thermoproteus sp.]|nr:pyridoxal-phosphate dependent enzyme [Thermoproteus sp.]